MIVMILYLWRLNMDNYSTSLIEIEPRLLRIHPLAERPYHLSRNYINQYNPKYIPDDIRVLNS